MDDMDHVEGLGTSNYGGKSPLGCWKSSLVVKNEVRVFGNAQTHYNQKNPVCSPIAYRDGIRKPHFQIPLLE